MNKVWTITVKYKAKGKDLFGHDFTGETRTWFTTIDCKSERIAKDRGRKVFEDSAEFKNCAKITNVRAAFVREY